MFRKTKHSVSWEKIASNAQERMAPQLLNNDTQLFGHLQMCFPGHLPTLMAVLIPTWDYFTVSGVCLGVMCADSWWGSFLLDLFIGMTLSFSSFLDGPRSSPNHGVPEPGSFPNSPLQLDEARIFQTYNISSVVGRWHEPMKKGQEKSGLTGKRIASRLKKKIHLCVLFIL